MKGDYGNSFSVCFNMMKIRYADYDKTIDELECVNPEDKINVFISFESILNNLSAIKDIDKKLILERDFPTILTSDILNIAAHYKRFFRQNNLETRVFIFYSDLESTIYNLEKYIDDYRSYYKLKYMNNPRYSYLGETLVERIIPDAQKIAEFINSVYFIKGTNIEGSIIPLVIANMDTSYKNFVITSDIYDAQYQLYDNFVCHCIKKSMSGAVITHNMKKTFTDIFKEKEPSDIPEYIIKNKHFFFLLCSCGGSKPRCIEPIKGMGIKSVIKLIINAVNIGIITEDTDQIDILVNIFPKELRDQVKSNYMAFNISEQIKLLTKQDIYNIESQMIDRFDNNSLLALNANIFFNHQLMLQELTM